MPENDSTEIEKLATPEPGLQPMESEAPNIQPAPVVAEDIEETPVKHGGVSLSCVVVPMVCLAYWVLKV